MANLCITNGCSNERLPGRGRRYCAGCRATADEVRKLDNRRRSKEWREQNLDRYKAWTRDYYSRTAEQQRARAREWYYANPERVAEHRQRQKALGRPKVAKYGLSHKDYEALLASQNGACAICGRTENGERRHLDVDHDHVTGQIRGLLCNRCNRLLSNAQDSIPVLRQAIAYLTGDT